MEKHALVPGDPSDREGGRYNVYGGQHILARNWNGVVYERKMKGVMSAVVCKDRALALGAVLDDCLKIFVDDAAIEPSVPSGRR